MAKQALSPEQPPLPLFDKRWRNGTERFVVPPHIFDPRHIRVKVIAARVAAAFIKEHHYLRTTPPARLSVGVFEKLELVGALVFSVSMNAQVIPHWLGVDAAHGVELGRMVLIDRIGFNDESYVIARALRLLKRYDSNLQGVVSFADPLARYDPLTTHITKAAHWGTMYRASNAAFRGRTSQRNLYISPKGIILSPRLLSKIRNEEQGRDYAERNAVAAGVPARAHYESGDAWLQRVLPTLARAHHPGNLAYTFCLKKKQPRQPFISAQRHHL